MKPVTVRDARFIAEAREAGSWPAPGVPEIAFAGRSNVGKSSLINRLAGRRALARTSKTPGRTRGLVFFDLDLVHAPLAQVRFVDLPGFGYAKVSQTERRDWQALVEGYVRQRPSLGMVLVLVDARRGMEAEERQLLEWLAHLGTQHRTVFTKTDKLRASERGALAAGRRGALLTSAETGDGLTEIWEVALAACLKLRTPGS